MSLFNPPSILNDLCHKTVILSDTDIEKFNEPDEPDVFYRYRTWTTSDTYYSVELNLERFRLVKKTPKGFWITFTWDNQVEWKKWVSASGIKRFAYPTKREAMVGYLKRTARYISILKSNLSDAKQGHKIAKQLLETK